MDAPASTDSGTKEWYFTAGADQAGPVSFEELKGKAVNGELHPRNDMVWKESMSEWVPAGQVDGLFAKRETDASAEALAKSVTAMEETKPKPPEEAVIIPGASRRWFILFTLIFPILWIVLCGVITAFVGDKLSSGFQKIFLLVGVIVPVWVVADVCLSRLNNLGMSKLWFLLHFVPVANLWLWYRCFACPAGYAKTKKLGGLGWFLAVVYWLFTISTAAAAVMLPAVFSAKLQQSGASEKIEALVKELKTIGEDKNETEAAKRERLAKEGLARKARVDAERAEKKKKANEARQGR